MRTMITFGLSVELAKEFDDHIYTHQLKKGQLIERLISKYLEDNSYDGLLTFQKQISGSGVTIKNANLDFVTPEKFD